MSRSRSHHRLIPSSSDSVDSEHQFAGGHVYNVAYQSSNYNLQQAHNLNPEDARPGWSIDSEDLPPTYDEECWESSDSVHDLEQNPSGRNRQLQVANTQSTLVPTSDSSDSWNGLNVPPTNLLQNTTDNQSCYDMEVPQATSAIVLTPDQLDGVNHQLSPHSYTILQHARDMHSDSGRYMSHSGQRQGTSRNHRKASFRDLAMRSMSQRQNNEDNIPVSVNTSDSLHPENTPYENERSIDTRAESLPNTPLPPDTFPQETIPMDEINIPFEAGGRMYDGHRSPRRLNGPQRVDGVSVVGNRPGMTKGDSVGGFLSADTNMGQFTTGVNSRRSSHSRNGRTHGDELVHSRGVPAGASAGSRERRAQRHHYGQVPRVHINTSGVQPRREGYEDIEMGRGAERGKGRGRTITISDPRGDTTDGETGDSEADFARSLQTMMMNRKRSSRASRHSKHQKRGSKKSLGGADSEAQMEALKRMYDPSYKPKSRHELMENIKLQKEIISTVRHQPWRIKRKIKTVRLAKSYVERYEGRLSRGQGYQERGAKVWRRFKRECINFLAFFVPWETRIKKIESHFGSVVSSYFTFARWLFSVNILLALLPMCFIIIPEMMVGDSFGSTPRKTIPEDELERALNFQVIWAWEGYLKYSVLFYGYYGNSETIGDGYRMPLAYLLTFFATLGISFIIVLRKMAANSRMSKLASKDEQFVFSWKLFTSWDFLIGNYEAAKNKAAEIQTSLRESILEEQEKQREENKSRLIALRVLANFMVLAVLASSTYAIYMVVDFSQEVDRKVLEGVEVSWWELNAVSLVMSIITALFPSLFDLIGLMEKYHPRINLRWQLARILVLYLLNMYTLVMALYNKIVYRQDNYRIAKAILDNATVACNTSSTIPPPTTQVWDENSTSTYPTLYGEWSEDQWFTENCSIGVTVGMTKKLELCWETMIGQEVVALTTFDLIISILMILLIDFVRGLAVRYLNPCWCWDLEKKFPEYGEFKIAENLLHLIYNQGIIWMGTFFAPALPALNLLKIVSMVYVRSWAVTVCNIPHERVFKASRSNNFYYAILLLMLFLSLLPVIFILVVLEPSPDCGPFSEYEKHYYVLTKTMDKELPVWFNEVMSYVASPGVIIPAFLLFFMAVYYLISLTRSLKEANSELRSQLLYERTEEKRKIYAMADAKTNDKKKAETAGTSSQKPGGGGRPPADGGGGAGAGRRLPDDRRKALMLQQAAALQRMQTPKSDSRDIQRAVPKASPRPGEGRRGRGNGSPPVAVVHGKPMSVRSGDGSRSKSENKRREGIAIRRDERHVV